MIKDPTQLLELVQLAKTFKPIISETLDEVLDDYGPELGKVVTRLRTFIVEETIASIEQYEYAGFSREQAIQLSLNTKLSLEDAIKRMKK